MIESHSVIVGQSPLGGQESFVWRPGDPGYHPYVHFDFLALGDAKVFSSSMVLPWTFP